MLPRWSRSLAIIFSLCLFVQLSLARSDGLVIRQDGNTPLPTPEPTGINQDEGGSPTDAVDAGDQEPTQEPTPTTDRKATPSESAVVITNTAAPPEPSHDIILEEPIPEGQLPLAPRLTPAYGVAGVLLIVSGLVYLAVGIKNIWLQTFFSVAFLANIATTVLIIYVMPTPVSDAVQGAYLVGIVFTGAVLGAGSTLFKEITAGLGCILGGFSLSMWILTLVPGGLIEQTAAKAAFIGALSAGSFGLFFSRYTRDYALMGLISFAGATATVLGIDCYSRAGLKEFWAYLWNLNDSLFPEGADTYPITKGMRVETAAIVFLCLMGIMSQLKLWRVIQKSRAKKAAEKAADDRNLRAEEEAVGIEVEKRTARDRRDWERVYGSGESVPDIGEDTTLNYWNSESGDMDEKQRMRVTSRTSTSPRSPAGETYVPETSDAAPDLPPRPPSSSPALMAPDEEDGSRVMVRVVPDDFPRAQHRGSIRDAAEQEWAENAGQVAHSSTSAGDSSETPRAVPIGCEPEVVPLPFQVTENEEDLGDDQRTAEDQSSIAGTCADDDEIPQGKGSSLVQRISQGSETRLARGGGASREELVAQRSMAEVDDDTGSLAATVDVESMDGDRSAVDNSDGDSMEMAAEKEGEPEPEKPAEPTGAGTTTRDLGATDVPSGKQEEEPSEVDRSGEAPVAGSSASKQGGSLSSASSTPVALTRDTLPKPLSRTALKYRTNEWVKHSTTADAPEPDSIQVQNDLESDESVIDENSAPLNIDELQQTATTGVPAPAPPSSPPRTATTAPGYQSRSVSGGVDAGPNSDGRNEPAITTPVMEDDRSSTRTLPTVTPLGRARGASGGSPPIVMPYASPQTLMGQRETYIRNKPLGVHNLLNAGMVDYSLPLYPTPGESAVPDYNYTAQHYRSHSRPRSPHDEDEMPLSQRRALIRQSSGVLGQHHHHHGAPGSYGAGPSATHLPVESPFNSHQPQRVSTVPHPAVREAQLANFRKSVAVDLRSGGPLLPAAARARESGMQAGRGLEVEKAMEAQRGLMMREKEAEAHAREAERWERQRRDGAFEAMMRSGELMGAHREAMKKLQGMARDG